MAQQIFTAHNLDFMADTMDWADAGDADRANEGLRDIITSFDADQAARLHDLLTRAVNDDGVDWAHPDLKALEDRCHAVASEVMKDYLRSPEGGHNCTILAA